MDSSPFDESGDGFANLGLRDELLDTLTELGYEEPTPVQRETIPHLIEGRDLVGQAATGTGKTAAFALPLLQSLDLGTWAPERPRPLCSCRPASWRCRCPRRSSSTAGSSA